MELTSGIRVTSEHARMAKIGGPGFLCASGIRGWCKRHRVDLRDFLDNGLAVEEMEAINDAYAQRLAAIARADAAKAIEVKDGQE
jgi:hypothetical protein